MNKKNVITWIDSSPTTYLNHIEIWRKTGIVGTYAKVSSNLSIGTQTFYDVNISDGSEYYYQVRAYNSVGQYSSIENSFYSFWEKSPSPYIPITPDNAVIESGMPYTSNPYVYGAGLTKRIWVNQDVAEGFSAKLFIEQSGDSECIISVCTPATFSLTDYYQYLNAVQR